MTHDVQGSAQPHKTGILGLICLCMLAILAVLTFLVLPIGVLLDYLHEKRVVGQAPAGVIVGVHPVGAWNPDSLIETTMGFYTVKGLVSLPRGVQFNLETRDNGARFLCTNQSQFCGRIVGRGLERAAPSEQGGATETGSTSTYAERSVVGVLRAALASWR